VPTISSNPSLLSGSSLSFKSSSPSLSASCQVLYLQVQVSHVSLVLHTSFLQALVVVCPGEISMYKLESENQGCVGLQSYLLICARSGTRIRTSDRL
jgi:hypothetical protein